MYSKINYHALGADIRPMGYQCFHYLLATPVSSKHQSCPAILQRFNANLEV